MPSPAVVRLANEDEPSIVRLLEQDRVTNLFLRSFVGTHPVDRAWWYGVGAVRGGPLRAVALVLPARLAVPWAPDPADADLLGAHLHRQHAPSLLVGPREAGDRLWARWAPGVTPRRRYDQRLYVLNAPPPGDDPPGFRLGTVEDTDQVVRNAAEMEREDLGTDPLAEGRAAHEAAVVDRLRTGRTWVVERGGRILFQVNVGTRHAHGCQLGGTYVPPDVRGKGLATAGVAATCRALLRGAPRVTLHVNEANTPAVRAYERAGFERSVAYRLIVP
jgi:hypothetical protein